MLKLFIVLFMTATFTFASKLTPPGAPKPVPTVKLQKVKGLTLAKPLQPGRPAHISAASGLVKDGEQFFTISDDEPALFSLRLADKHAKAHPLLNQTWPIDPTLRKKIKADYETLMALDKKQWPPHGALVAWPSCSTDERTTAVILPRSAKGFAAPVVVVISKLARTLKKKTKDVNIEGLIVHENEVLLFQRGHSGDSDSGVFKLKWSDWLNGVKTGKWPKAVSFFPVEIGSMQEVKLTISDAVTTPHGLIAIASAEATNSSYADGVIAGTALIRLTGSRAKVLAAFSPTVKLEGIALGKTLKNSTEFFFVDDTDNPAVQANLYKIVIQNDQLK